MKQCQVIFRIASITRSLRDFSLTFLSGMSGALGSPGVYALSFRERTATNCQRFARKLCDDYMGQPLMDREPKIVSSRHLAEGDGWEASEVEYGMIIAFHAFSRWMVRCMSAAGNSELTPLEILVLHNTNHRAREKRLSDICFMLAIEDTHTVNYALRKLMKAGLLSSEKRGKEVFYSTSPTGAELCAAYRNVREKCFLDGLKHLELTGEVMRDMASALRTLSGHYDQASRAAASL